MDIIVKVSDFIVWFYAFEIPFGGYTFRLMDFIIWGFCFGVALAVFHFFMSD